MPSASLGWGGKVRLMQQTAVTTLRQYSHILTPGLPYLCLSQQPQVSPSLGAWKAGWEGDKVLAQGSANSSSMPASPQAPDW